MKTLVISSFHPLMSRNILAAGVLTKLLRKPLRVVLIVPEKKIAYFKDQFESENVRVEGVEISPKPFDSLLYTLSMSLVGVENHIVRGWKTEGKYVRYYTAHSIHALLSRFLLPRRLLRAVMRRYVRVDSFDEIFEEYLPDAVFSTDVFDPLDRALLIEASRRRVQSIGMLRSWDNPTTKGVLIAEPDTYLVTNRIVKDELVCIHGVDPALISVVGIPHYDSVRRPRARSHEEVFRASGLDPAKKTLFYSPGGKILYKHDGEMLQMLKRVIDSGSIRHQVQVLVSIQPADTIDTSAIENDPNFVIHRFGVNVTGRKKESEMTAEENEVLNDFLTYSDVLLTLVSTMAIDGTVFDKPVIVLGFDPVPNLPDKVAKFARYAHFKKFLDTGLVALSRSEEDLVAQLNTFLREPDSNRSAREAIVEMYAHKLDGKSAERVVQKLLEAVR